MVGSPIMERKRFAVWILIAALVVVFGWFGIDKLRNGILWIGFLPAWMEELFQISRDVWIIGIGFFEILLAILLLVPVRRVRQVAVALMILHLIPVLIQVGWNDVGVRDVGLMLSAVALLVLL